MKNGKYAKITTYIMRRLYFKGDGFMKTKIDTTALLSIGATVLTIAATLVGQKSNDKQMQKAVQEEVAKALENMSKISE
jgi:hypothetical protein